MKKVIVILAVFICVTLIGWRVYVKVWAEEAPSGGRGARAIPVEVKPVQRRTVRHVEEFTGTLVAKSQFVVAPKVSGRLEELKVNIGDTVKNGDLIAVLDSAEYAQQVAQAKAELAVGRANHAETQSALDVATREYDRAKELRQQKVASEAELDEAKARFNAAEAKHAVAEAQIKQKEAALAAAEVRLSYTRIHASWTDGGGTRTVAERFKDEGNMLGANDPIVTIVDGRTVLAIINVIERDFPDIRVGQVATITTDAYPDRQFVGKVARRAPVLKEESRQARVEIEIPNPDGLLAPGMFARARIQFAEHSDATVVPASALVRRDGRQGVFLVDGEGKKVRFVAVTVGITEEGWAEILQPQLQGSVVTLGQHLLEDGMSIVLPKTGPPSRQQPSSRPAAGG